MYSIVSIDFLFVVCVPDMSGFFFGGVPEELYTESAYIVTDFSESGISAASVLTYEAVQASVTFRKEKFPAMTEKSVASAIASFPKVQTGTKANVMNATKTKTENYFDLIMAIHDIFLC
ncbi:hypothetical protein J5839_01245 [Methanosarcinaceae archaeon]|nr:hypothetical protein [Methanosarcinaceae archaeon]